MGIKLFDFLKPKNGKTESVEVNCRIFWEAAQEYQIRALCWSVCLDMIANALGKCEFRTYMGGKEVQGDEYYLWNIEPNINQNSSAFLHKFVTRLYEDGESLMISTKSRAGKEMLVVADSFTPPDIYPARQNEYRDVTVGEITYDKTFRENEVMHLQLNNPKVKDVIDGMYTSYYRMYDAAVKAYTWGQGQHWKVHVNQIAQGADGWAKTFQEMIQAQIKPFLDSNGAILPEFDGYKYENVGYKGDAKETSRDIKALVDDIFEFTARGLLIPAVLVNGKVEAAGDANNRFLTYCIDPLCDQLQEEAIRKRYGLEEWKKGNFLRVDSSSIIHFDLFANAANVEKLVGSGAFTINDVLKAANRPPINEPWADKHYMTKNIAAMSEVLKTAES